MKRAPSLIALALLAGCAIGGPKVEVRIYDPAVAVAADPAALRQARAAHRGSSGRFSPAL